MSTSAPNTRAHDAPEADRDADPPNAQRRRLSISQLLAGAGIGIGVTAAIVAFSTVTVCDQQASSTGHVVRVCRHLQTTDPPVLAVALVMLAALGAFFTEVAGFGLSFKREVRDNIGRAVETAKETKKRTEEVATVVAQATDELRETVGDLAERSAYSPADDQEEDEAPPDESPDAMLRFYAAEYNRIRREMPRGLERTKEMNEIVSQMKHVIREVHDFDARASLFSSDRGLRLAAYVYLSEYVEPAWTGDLIRSLIDVEDKPFGQYQALRALSNQVEHYPSVISADMRRRLETELRPRLPPGSRTKELTNVFRLTEVASG